MQKIKAIIFDLGGVLLNLDFDKLSTAFKALGVTNFDELFSQSKADILFENLETGKITHEEFCNAFTKYTSKPITSEDVTQAWNSILQDFRPGSLAHLAELRKKYKLFLLSNTNSIHYRAFNKIFDTAVGKNSFNALFDKAYYSHQMGLRKPNAAAYRYILEENNLKPEETVFIDDTLSNIEGAKAVGLQTIFLDKGMKIEDLDL